MTLYVLGLSPGPASTKKKTFLHLFSEGVVSYSIPQGMVRGASLELMDHTFDGIEDSQTGDLVTKKYQTFFQQNKLDRLLVKKFSFLSNYCK